MTSTPLLRWLFTHALMLSAAAAFAAEPVISADVRAGFATINAHSQVKKGIEFLKADDANTLAELKAMVVIPAPPFKEKA